MSIFLFVVTGLVLKAPKWAAKQVASPPRRPLQEYHREITQRQVDHGIQIGSFHASDGTPTLVVTPKGEPGKRGKLLREQLAEQGFTLGAYGQTRGTLVLLHGRMGRKEDFLPIAERFSAVGFRCVIPDLPAHGDHPAKFVTYGLNEQTIPRLVLEEAAAQFHFPVEPAGVFGISMGSSVAIHSAARNDFPWNSLIVISSFDNLANTVEREVSNRIGSPLAARWFPSINQEYLEITSHKMEEIEPWRLAKRINVPVFVGHGTVDELIPLKESRRLFQSFPAHPKNHWVSIPDGDHNNALITPYLIYAEMAGWMLSLYPDDS